MSDLETKKMEQVTLMRANVILGEIAERAEEKQAKTAAKAEGTELSVIEAFLIRQRATETVLAIHIAKLELFIDSLLTDAEKPRIIMPGDMSKN